MEVRGFESTLSLADKNIKDPNRGKYVDFIMNLSKSLGLATRHIRSICKSKTDGESVTQSEIEECIMDDYNELLKVISNNTYIYSLTMKYVAIRYLEAHSSEIPALRDEIEKRGLVYKVGEAEIYTDNFHENLLIALLALEYDYKTYSEGMNKVNEEFLAEIQALVDTYGKEDGFKRYCDKYSKMNLNFSQKRIIIVYAYLTIFGVDGIDSSTPAVEKYKRTYSIKRYITAFAERVESDYRNQLVKAIEGLVLQIDSFISIEQYAAWNDAKMLSIELPGLRYAISAQSANAQKREIERIYSVSSPDRQQLAIKDKKIKAINDRKENSANPTAKTLLSANELSKLPIESLLSLNSYYYNRMAKIIEDYALTLFIIEKTGIVMDIVQGKEFSKKDFAASLLEYIVLEYEVLRLPLKRFNEDTQRDLDGNWDKYKDRLLSNEKGDGLTNLVDVDVTPLMERVKEMWGDEFQIYFDEKLPGVNHDLESTISLVNGLYSPITFSYEVKHITIKSEYAYMYYLAEMHPELNLNFGLALRKGENPEEALKKRVILVTYDSGLTFPNRLHTFTTGYIDFIKAYTGSPFIRLYQGIEDFECYDEYITAQVLTPIPSRKVKYLETLRKRK